MHLGEVQAEARTCRHEHINGIKSEDKHTHQHRRKGRDLQADPRAPSQQTEIQDEQRPREKTKKEQPVR